MFVKAEHETSSLREEDEGLHLKIKLSEGANNGCDFDVFAVVSNNTDAERGCRLLLCARTASSRGAVGPQCGMKDLLNLSLEPRSGEERAHSQGRAAAGSATLPCSAAALGHGHGTGTPQAAPPQCFPRAGGAGMSPAQPGPGRGSCGRCFRGQEVAATLGLSAAPPWVAPALPLPQSQIGATAQ